MTLALFGTEVHWALPWAFALLPLPWLVRRLAPPRRVPQPAALRVPDAGRFRVPSAVQGGARSRWRTLLLIGMWCALLLALARPQGFGEPLGLPSAGRDLMLAIDISNSMRETDLYAGNQRAMRIDVVRAVARDFVTRRDGDRIGLVMFGSQAYVQTPLTADHTTVRHFLDEATVGLAGRETAIGDAIGLATKRLRDAPGNSRVLVLLTDGENSAGVVDPLDAAAIAAASGIRIHTIGVGSEGGGLLGMRRSAIDERTLGAIADATGGRYFRARSGDELERIYALIDELEPSEVEGEELRPLKELQAWPLSVALLLSLAATLLPMWRGQSGQAWRGARREPL